MSPSTITQVDVSHLNDRWSYLVNLTLIGNAVYLSMDLPDTWLAVCLLLSLTVQLLILGIVLQNTQLPANGKDKDCCILVVPLYMEVCIVLHVQY